jgi:hypothetical protein
MTSDELIPTEVLGHGAYLCVRRSGGGEVRSAGAPLAALARRLGLENEFDPGGTPPRESVAFLRRQGAVARDIADEDVLTAEAIIHVASKAMEPVTEFCREGARLLGPAAHVRVLSGVVRPKMYTGAAMERWAYGRAVVQQPGPAMPNAFFVPLSKTADWWAKDWMERHTYFLPRYDETGRMQSEGHALATAAGIPCLLRRTYRHASSPAPAGEYDFLTYFECADRDIPTFHQVCDALRDTKRNPEWRFVLEGPTWQGRRVATWAALWD